MHEIIAAKAENREPRQVEEEAAPAGQVVDLMAALETPHVAMPSIRRGRDSNNDALADSLAA
ncbi:hypothetical protein ABZ615_11755 [Streptomyces sp. NPDC007325]|uniref:hypothetical protein n=1 Tax=Streptomyces sp. NPDC007325 TaxID=3154588 RepID=UPI0033D1B719